MLRWVFYWAQSPSAGLAIYSSIGTDMTPPTADRVRLSDFVVGRVRAIWNLGLIGAFLPEEEIQNLLVSGSSVSLKDRVLYKIEAHQEARSLR